MFVRVLLFPPPRKPTADIIAEIMLKVVLFPPPLNLNLSTIYYKKLTLAS